MRNEEMIEAKEKEKIRKGTTVLLFVIAICWTGYLVFDGIQAIRLPDHEFSTEGIIFLAVSISGIITVNSKKHSYESFQDVKPKKKAVTILLTVLALIAFVLGIVSMFLVI